MHSCLVLFFGVGIISLAPTNTMSLKCSSKNLGITAKAKDTKSVNRQIIVYFFSRQIDSAVVDIVEYR